MTEEEMRQSEELLVQNGFERIKTNAPPNMLCKAWQHTEQSIQVLFFGVPVGPLQGLWTWEIRRIQSGTIFEEFVDAMQTT